MTFLLPYDTLQEEKISNSFLERLKFEKLELPSTDLFAALLRSLFHYLSSHEAWRKMRTP